MARWRDRGWQPEIPDWIGHNGFVLADWEWPEDAGLPAVLAEHRARTRWVATRHRWLQEHPGVGEILLEELRQRVRAKRRDEQL